MVVAVREKRGVPTAAGGKGGKPFPPRAVCLLQCPVPFFRTVFLHNGVTITRWNLSLGGVRMLDYKVIIIKHYGGGMSGNELAGQGLGSRSGINDFLRAFEASDKIRYSGSYTK